MKLRIPRRIKVEDETSDESEGEPIADEEDAAAMSGSSKALAQQDEIHNSQVHATTKSISAVVSSYKIQ
jgi:hypothetical protein